MLSACAASGGGAVPPAPVGPPCEWAAGIDTRSWRPVTVGAFSFRLPPGYREQRTRGIDSVVRRWRSRNGRFVDLDYGMYTARFEDGPGSRMGQPMIECAAGDGTAAPQIVIYRSIEGEHVVGLYWPVPGGRALEYGANRHVQRDALWLEASSHREQDLPELLAIVRSVALRQSR